MTFADSLVTIARVVGAAGGSTADDLARFAAATSTAVDDLVKVEREFTRLQYRMGAVGIGLGGDAVISAEASAAAIGQVDDVAAAIRTARMSAEQVSAALTTDDVAIVRASFDQLDGMASSVRTILERTPIDVPTNMADSAFDIVREARRTIDPAGRYATLIASPPSAVNPLYRLESTVEAVQRSLTELSVAAGDFRPTG